MKLDLNCAKALSEAAKTAAKALGRHVSIAVVDHSGFPVLVERMDGSLPLAAAVAVSKAYTAAIMRLPTHQLRAWADREPVFFSQVSRMGSYPLIAAEGGVTVLMNDMVVGGVGVSGGTGQEDLEICNAALAENGLAVCRRAAPVPQHEETLAAGDR